MKPNNKTFLQKIMIKLGLNMLRRAGDKTKVISESPQDIYQRRLSYVEQLVDAGYSVRRLTPYQIRINERLDIYPKNARWHDIKLNKRGGFRGKNLARFVRVYFGEI